MQHPSETPGERDPASAFLSPSQNVPKRISREGSSLELMVLGNLWHNGTATLYLCYLGHPSFPWFVHLENGDDDASLPEVPSTVA